MGIPSNAHVARKMPFNVATHCMSIVPKSGMWTKDVLEVRSQNCAQN